MFPVVVTYVFSTFCQLLACDATLKHQSFQEKNLHKSKFVPTPFVKFWYISFVFEFLQEKLFHFGFSCVVCMFFSFYVFRQGVPYWDCFVEKAIFDELTAIFDVDRDLIGSFMISEHSCRRSIFIG